MHRVLGINGIRSDGSASTDLLLKELEADGYATVEVNYPRVSLLKVPFLRFDCLIERDARRIVRLQQKGDCIIAHSYGCLLTLMAMQLGAQFDTVIWFAPAMDKDMVIPRLGCRRLYVIYNPNDKAMGFAKFLWLHKFGEMGRTGYEGNYDSRITNVKDFSLLMKGHRHSHYFDPANLKLWADWVKKVLLS